MGRWGRRLAILAALAALVVVLRLTLLRPKPVAVTMVEVAKGRVEATVVNSKAGTVESRLRAKMSPGIAGLVDEIPAHKGEHVRKGQTLLRLDSSEYQAAVALAERSLDAARASADQTCLQADQAARVLERARGLAQSNLVSPQDFEDDQTNAQGTAAACRAARARAREAEASLASARATLTKTTMVAPFDGVVLDVTTQVGEWISPSPPGVFIPPVIDVIDPDSLYVQAPLDEADVARIHVGLPVRITLDAFKGRDFAGTLSYVASYVTTEQEQNRTLTVEAVFTEKNLPENLLPGLSADIEVILDAHDNVLRIPTYALLEGDRVYVVRDGRVHAVDVKTGLRNWQYVEVLDGLHEHERVVTSLDRPDVKPGVRVVVQQHAAD